MQRLRDLLLGARRLDLVNGMRARVVAYRDLLARNNLVLELMTDGEEKLGGEYIFDNQYLRRLDAELAEAVGGVVRDLSQIAPGRYRALADAFVRIRGQVLASTQACATSVDGVLCMDLARIGSEHANAVGEKMSRLGELGSRVEAPIPPGFVMTGAAFDDVIRSRSVVSLIAAADAADADLPAIAAQLRARLESVSLPRRVVRAIKSSLRRYDRHTRFAVRSSAIGEDSELSFAGMHTTLLNVPRGRVIDAYRRVIASLFSERALLYRRSHKQPLQGATMAVGCIRMVPAVASGVLYTFDPTDPSSDLMLVNAAWGYGATVVEGTGVADRFQVARQPPYRTVEAVIAEKATQLVGAPDGDLQRVAAPTHRQGLPSMRDADLEKLATIALNIERHMHHAQDIEWALDEEGCIWIVQARPLRLGPSPTIRSNELSRVLADCPVLMLGKGAVACRGIGAGRVVMVTPTTSETRTPPGSVLVTQYPSPSLSRLLPTAAALIADSGSPTGHLATLAREYRVPAVMATQIASQTLEPGTEVTVDAEENIVYAGRVEPLIRYSVLRGDPYEDSREFRLLRGMLKRVTPLHLKDPESRYFTPAHCTSYHDIIRFAHEKAVVALADLSEFNLHSARHHLRRVLLDIPLGLSLIDLGGGVAADAPAGDVELAKVTCTPLAVVLSALAAPGVWGTRPADMDLTALMSSVTRSGSVTEFGAMEIKRNLAIVTARYMNLSLYLGYHFNVIDCYLGESPEDSSMFFRFAGGVSELGRRVRRATLLDEILSHYGFTVERVGDLVVARLHGISETAMQQRLKMTGRLIGFTRQLDVMLRSEAITERMVREFLAGGSDPTRLG